MTRQPTARTTLPPIRQPTDCGYKGPGANTPRKYVKGSLSDAYIRNTGIRQKTPHVEYHSTCKALGIDPNSHIASQLELDGAPVPGDDLLGGDHVSFRDTYLGDVGFIAILPLLHMNKRWTSLDASNNGLRNEAVIHLVDMLLQPQHMNGRRFHLDFSRNPISEGAGRALIELARKNPHIQDINVRLTKVPSRVVATLREALRNSQSRHAAELRKEQEAQAKAAELARVEAAKPSEGGNVESADIQGEDVQGDDAMQVMPQRLDTEEQLAAMGDKKDAANLDDAENWPQEPDARDKIFAKPIGVVTEPLSGT